MTKRPLRYAVTKDGKPIRMPDGRPLMTLAGSGPPVAIRFGGTAFVAGQDGMLITIACAATCPARRSPSTCTC